MNTIKFLPIKESINYVNTEFCAECVPGCPGHLVRLPIGRSVLVRGTVEDGVFIVNGIARPTMHGGGVHVTATDSETGARISAIVGGCFTR